MTTYTPTKRQQLYGFGRGKETSSIGKDLMNLGEKLSLSPNIDVVLEYSFGVDGAIAASGGSVPLRVAGTNDQFIIPEGFQVARTRLRVTETFTSTTDAAALSIGLLAVANGGTDDDNEGLVAEAAISAGGNVWDATAKFIDGIQTGTAATASEETTENQYVSIKNDHGSEANTAGAVKVFLTLTQI